MFYPSLHRPEVKIVEIMKTKVFQHHKVLTDIHIDRTINLLMKLKTTLRFLYGNVKFKYVEYPCCHHLQTPDSSSSL